MHHSKLSSLIIDCKVDDLEEAANFWSQALGRPILDDGQLAKGKYARFDMHASEPIVEVQKVTHESRVHIDIESDDIAAEVRRLEKLGAKVVETLPRWVVMQAPTGQKFCVVNPQDETFSDNANRWD